MNYQIDENAKKTIEKALEKGQRIELIPTRDSIRIFTVSRREAKIEEGKDNG